ncbi:MULTISPECIES: MFS transporter [Actinosynnema]|uniref:MFS transporter n=1 Tax=Actinosynnema TaxID=40566 RepID=UPI0020A3000E|nr:MFS transporter [Actinosynnema pretiosum]MCP2096289.1 putative arabinose efflux permease, MFS family [Actinosynnema pretiosum]
MTAQAQVRHAPTRTGSRDWRRVAAAMAVIGWGGNQFTPLLLVYRDRAGYSQLDVDVFLGGYVVGLVPGLLVAAALSDRRGRRPVLAGGVWTSLLGSLLLAAGPVLGYAGIFAGRALSGVAVGVAMAVGTAWVSELAAADPALAPGTGARRATVWLTCGFALGPASAGLLAQFAEPALVLPYAVHAVLCLPVLRWVLAARRAETGGRSRAPLWRALRVPAAGHRRFVRVVLPMAPWIFGSAGIAYAIVPQQVGGEVGGWALLHAVGLTVATLGTGVLVQPLARRLDSASTARAVVVSMLVMVAGVALAAVTAQTRSPWLAVGAALLLGGAYGIAVVSGLLEVQRIAGPGELAGLTGVYYALAYAGFLLPALLAALSGRFGYPATLGVVALVCPGCASGWSKHLPQQ